MLGVSVLLNSEVAIGRLQSKYPEIDFSKSVYKGAHEVLTAVCPKHGEITKKVTHWSINGCVQCNKEFRQSSDYVHGTPARVSGWKRHNEQSRLTAKQKWLDWTKTEEAQKFDFSESEYVKSRANIRVRCKEHDIWFTGYPDSFIEGRNACPECVKRRVKDFLTISEDQRVVQARVVHGDRYEYVSVPDTRHGMATIKCPVHGEFSQNFGNHLQGNGCPACVGSTSKGEISLAEFVASLVPIRTKVRDVISPKELDIFVPSTNVAVEYNGLYWHSEDYAGTQHMRNKWELTTKLGTRLINVFEDEWMLKTDIVKRSIVAALGLSRTTYAKVYTVAPVSKPDAEAFLNNYHISGNRNGSYRVGLYVDKELHAVLVCGSHATHQWEIIRYAASHNIVGGFRRLFSKFVQELNPANCVSYCDLRYGRGKTYEDAGFKLDKITDPDYWWYKKNTRIPRYQTQKHKLNTDPRFRDHYDPGLSETEICTAAGYRRIWGVGHNKYIWTRSK